MYCLVFVQLQSTLHFCIIKNVHKNTLSAYKIPVNLQTVLSLCIQDIVTLTNMTIYINMKGKLYKLRCAHVLTHTHTHAHTHTCTNLHAQTQHAHTNTYTHIHTHIHTHTHTNTHTHTCIHTCAGWSFISGSPVQSVQSVQSPGQEKNLSHDISMVKQF